jgi:hypothetical protein
MKSVRPWQQNTDCPELGFAEFKQYLMDASYHNAAEGRGEAGGARVSTAMAAEIAIENEWPYWAMERMFKDIRPLVAWDQFMQSYLNLMFEKITT